MTSDIQIINVDGLTEIKIIGRLDFSQARKEDEVVSLIGSSDIVVIDFSDCEYIDSSGLGFLLIIQKAVKEKSRLRITGCNSLVKETLSTAVIFPNFFVRLLISTTFFSLLSFSCTNKFVCLYWIFSTAFCWLLNVLSFFGSRLFIISPGNIIEMQIFKLVRANGA